MDGSSFFIELQSIQHGLSNRDLTNQQLTCYFFVGGYVYTYNEECICRRKTSLPEEVIGEGLAIQAAPLLALASRFSSDRDLSVSIKEGHLVLAAKKRRAGVVVEQEFNTNPSEFLKVPKKSQWSPIPAELPGAIEKVVTTASRNGTHDYALMCVHLTPKYVESSDTYQLSRHMLTLPIEDSLIVRHEVISGVVGLGASDMAVDESWVYFRSRAGVVMAYSRYVEAEFPDLSEPLKRKGTPVKLPETMGAIVDKAKVMLDDVKDGEFDVTLTSKICTLHGRGPRGWYTEKVAVEYSGPDITFRIAPSMLAAISSEDMTCEVKIDDFNSFIKAVSEDKKFVYMASLNQNAEEE